MHIVNRCKSLIYKDLGGGQAHFKGGYDHPYPPLVSLFSIQEKMNKLHR